MTDNAHQRARELRFEDLDAVGQMMLQSARTIATGGAKIPEEYLLRVLSRRKNLPTKEV